MMCPHCKNKPRNAVIFLQGDYWCDKCLQEIWELVDSARMMLKVTKVQNFGRDCDCPICSKMRKAIAALEVQE